ncbi:MAG: DEAD/DEAH box helicase [Planctomycetaceae bacterium]|jgi:SNF2 family DNA or RNA helicase|nr:DEAD/DEAH box helicase [Planctomycetaceae bacterium]
MIQNLTSFPGDFSSLWPEIAAPAGDWVLVPNSESVAQECRSQNITDENITEKTPVQPIKVFSVRDFMIPVKPFVTGWNKALTRKIDLNVRSVAIGKLRSRVTVLSMPVHGAAAIPVNSFLFGPGSSVWKISESENREKTAARPKPESESALTEPERRELPEKISSQYTRFRIPPDAIKLEDRLNYLLQPPLETILSQPSLNIPFEPFPYQRAGISFLYSSHKAILADEMGLGKTMQAITTIRLLLRNGELRNALLVCPKPLVTNWIREFGLWAPELHVQVIEGNPARRKWLWQLDDIPIRIANYELLNRDREYYDRPRSQGGIHFDLVVLDESQRIKNQNGATSQAVRALSRSRNWALTGTPVENSSDDLVGIFEFLAPGYLSNDLKPAELGERVGDYILRRTKDKVLTDLPPKLFRDAELELTSSQQQSYHLAEEEGVMRLKDMERDITIQHVFELVLRLKQICNFDPATGESTKMERLLADLEEVAESGRKAIIFSQWVDSLTQIKKHLARFNPVEYHGRIPSKLRDGVIQKFRDDPDCHVILMSYGAGSVGLNLQFAGYVFLFDRWWNPAVEDQAINRAHRIGASGPVTVTRFLVANTIEEKIDRILREKRELFETIMSGARGLNTSTGMNQDEIFGLFNLRVPRPRAATPT